MRSLGNSTKKELFEQLFDSISEEFAGVLLPPEERNFILWDNGDGLAEERIKKRKAELLEKFGTTEGFDPMIIGWGKPDEPTGPDEEKEA